MPAGSANLLISLILLIIFSGFFSATETAYSCASRIKLRTLFSNGNKRAGHVLKLSEEHYDNFLSTILVGNNIVNLSASAISTLLFAKIIFNSKIDSTVISTIVITVAVLIFGEIIPKFIAKNFPEKIAMTFYPLVIFFYYVLYPINIFFVAWQVAITKIFKIKNTEVITEDEIMTFVEEAQEDGTLKQDETKLIRSVIEFDDLEVEDIFIPRVNISAVELHDDINEIRDVFAKSGFSRLPIYNKSIDCIIGFIHEKDFYNIYVNKTKSISDIVQKGIFTTQHTKISKLLKTLQQNRVQMAIVLDEYGGTMGIVTIEDILEELVGEIYDEHDKEILEFKKISESHFIFNGNAALDNCFEVLGIAPENAEQFEANTIGGWAIELLGEIPTNGKKFEYENLSIEILKSSATKVLKLCIRKK